MVMAAQSLLDSDEDASNHQLYTPSWKRGAEKYDNVRIGLNSQGSIQFKLRFF
jgi:hypothetical protein